MSLSDSTGIFCVVVGYNLEVVLPQGHKQSYKISIDARPPVFVQGSAILNFQAWLSHLTDNQSYRWSIGQPCVGPFQAGVVFVSYGGPR